MIFSGLNFQIVFSRKKDSAPGQIKKVLPMWMESAPFDEICLSELKSADAPDTKFDRRFRNSIIDDIEIVVYFRSLALSYVF